MSGTDALSLRAISASSSCSRADVRCCQTAEAATPPITTSAPTAIANSRVQRRGLGLDRSGDPRVRVARRAGRRRSAAGSRLNRRGGARRRHCAPRPSGRAAERDHVAAEHAAMLATRSPFTNVPFVLSEIVHASSRRDPTRAARRGASRRRGRRPDRSGDRCSDADRWSRPASRTASTTGPRPAGEDAELDRHGSYWSRARRTGGSASPCAGAAGAAVARPLFF